MGKMTKAQLRALGALPCKITIWGGKPFAGLPNGIKTRATLFALNRAGAAQVDFHGVTEHWTITDAGRLALEEHNGKPGDTP